MRKDKTGRINTIGHCFGKHAEKEGQYAVIQFDNNSIKLVKIYEQKKKGLKYIVNDYKMYSITNKENSVYYDFEYIGKYEKNGKKHYSLPEEIEKTEKKVEIEVKTEKAEKIEEIPLNKDVKHKEYVTILSCVSANVPVYLYGAAGSGKNYTVKEIAKELGLEFYFTNSVQQEYKITGFIDAGGVYHETEFYKAFKNGGLFFLDELDASIPEVLILLNAAIANGYFEFPNGRIEANENFRVIAAGNTCGTGADELYNGRNQLDAATLDRFVMIEFNYDTNIELKIANGNRDLIDFVHELRQNNETYGFNRTFSYRCIEYICKLEKSSLTLEKVLQIVIFKGMELDDIKMFVFTTKNKYTDAVKNIIAA